MKKFVAGLLCFLIPLSLFSCNVEKANDNNINTIDDNKNTTAVTSLGDADTLSSNKTQAEIAMKMYEAAINDEICIYDERLGEIELKSLCFTSNNTSLAECKLLTSAMLDVDQDGVNEYVIQSPDYECIILRYHNGKVYSYRLDTADFYNFNTDGTFYWYDSSEEGEWECGLNKIAFDGETLNIKSIYSLQYSKNPTKYEYFVEGEAVTDSEYYRNHTHKEEMKFSQFELTCSYPITAEQAWNLANAYWDHQNGHTDAGAGTVVTAKIVLIDTPNSDTNEYRVALQWEFTSNVREGGECMPPYDIQLKDQILVNAFTREITASTYEPGGKGVSVEEAIEIAKNYRSYMSGEICNEENGYRVELAPNAQAPEHVYVIIIQKYDTVTDRIWIDKNAGKTISPYYLYGK